MISVCIATYNGEKYIKSQIESILNQLSMDDEIIISDDSSTDNTLQIIQSFDDYRIKIYNNIFCGNATFNFENALNQSRGDIIIFADQDDIWLENRIAKIIPLMDNYELVINDCYVVDSEINIVSQSYFSLNNSKLGIWNNIYNCSYLGCCMAFKREILIKAIPFPKHIIAHDIWIGLIAEIYGKALLFNDKLIYYRRHSTNLSYAASKSKNKFLFKIKYRIILISLLLGRVIINKYRNAHNSSF